MTRRAIAYALFSTDKGNFTFASYLRGLLMAIRSARLVYPDWVIVLETDQIVYDTYKGLFDALPVVVNVNEPAPLTKAMLWRLKPVFCYNEYSHVICRDLDSPLTYREAQCVQEWIESDLAAHAITDSVSHGIPMMGGMIGFVTKYWPTRTGFQHWTDMFNDAPYDFTKYNADQELLLNKVYKRFADPGAPAIMQHYILGMPNTFLPGYRNTVPSISVPGVSPELAESNDTCSHMGQAGWQLEPTFKMYRKYQDRFTDLLEIEKNWPDVAYWVKDGTFD